MIVFDRLNNCPGYYRTDVVSLAGFDVSVDQPEDVVNNGTVQLSSFETAPDDFVYLIDSNGRHLSSLRWLKGGEHKSPTRAMACSQNANRFFFDRKNWFGKGDSVAIAKRQNKRCP
jgi:hypothetical protein